MIEHDQVPKTMIREFHSLLWKAGGRWHTSAMSDGTAT
jgi:hypothetical protein